MQNESRSYYGVMEGDGAYNRHARLQAGGIALALPFLEQAARNVTLDGGNQPVVVVDYGSSQGKNSLAPMRTAIAALRTRLAPDRPISVVHVDQAANDFNTLFDVLHRDPDRYGWRIRTYFLLPSGGRSTEACFRPILFIWGGVPTPSSGSAGSPR